MHPKNSFDSFTFTLNQTSLIEASAGTGKTYSIVNMFIRLLLNLGETKLTRFYQAKEILLVTFTNNSVNEMQERVIARMRSLQLLIGKLLHLSKTQDLTSEQAFSVLSQEEKLDEFTQRCLEQLCCEDRLTQAYQVLEQELLTNEFSIKTLDKFIGDAIVEIDSELDPDTIRTFPISDLKKLNDRRADIFRMSLSSTLREQIAFIDAQGANGVKVFEELCQLATGNLVSHKHPELPKINVKENYFSDHRIISERYQDSLLTFIVNAIYQNISPEDVAKLYYQYGFNEQTSLFDLYKNAQINTVTQVDLFNQLRIFFTHKVLTKFLHYCFKNKELDLNSKAILLLQKLTLSQNTDYATALEIINNKYRFVFIDEFQDTSPIQFEIIKRLFIEYKQEAEKGLIMIGDPKQAIYAFRGADIFNYFEAQETAVKAPDLNKNYRSSKIFIEACNYLFTANSNFFTLPQIKYQVVEAGNPEKPVLVVRKQDGELEIVNPLNFVVNQEENKLSSEEALVAFIAKLVELGKKHQLFFIEPRHLQAHAQEHLKPIKASDICILTGNNNEVVTLANLLKFRHQIDSDIKGQGGQDDAFILEDLTTCLKAICDPNNQTLVRKYIYSSLSGLTLEKIEQTLVEANLYLEVKQQLKDWQKMWQEQSLTRTLDALIKTNVVFANLKLPQNFAENLWQTFNLLLEMLANPQDQAQTLIQLEDPHFIKEFYDQGKDLLIKSKKTHELNQGQGFQTGDKVMLMTMHKSKGLEFPLVLAYSGKSVRSLKEEVKWNLDSIQPKFANFYNYNDLIEYRYFQDIKQSDTARLLYVAATRAQVAMFYFLNPDLMEAIKEYANLESLNLTPYANQTGISFTSELAPSYLEFSTQAQKQGNTPSLLAFYRQVYTSETALQTFTPKLLEFIPLGTLASMAQEYEIASPIVATTQTSLADLDKFKAQTLHLTPENELKLFPVHPQYTVGLQTLLQQMQKAGTKSLTSTPTPQVNNLTWEQLELLGKSLSSQSLAVRQKLNYLYPQMTTQELKQQLPSYQKRSFSSVNETFLAHLDLEANTAPDLSSLLAQSPAQEQKDTELEIELLDGNEQQEFIDSLEANIVQKLPNFSQYAVDSEQEFILVNRNLPRGSEFGTKVHNFFEVFFEEFAQNDFTLKSFIQRYINFAQVSETLATQRLVGATLEYPLLDLNLLRRSNDLEQAINALPKQGNHENFLYLNTKANKETISTTTEWEFYFNQPQNQEKFRKLIPEFVKILAKHQIISLTADFDLEIDQFNGFIDLIIFTEQEIIVIDYKTNYLGANLEAYRGQLREKMLSSGYILQMYIYLAAVYGHCRQNIFAHNPEQLKEIKFIGMHLFLRGLLYKPQREKYGIFAQMPSHQLLDELSDLIINQ
ncbi:UvrD-helicase domain-containing protein [Psittacicella gerlachiana]|uniref:DNA 3'-5' helicase n=1 Tax=Psittacicella gerlachiana TaxID=2028574 RepID=A0A3A1YLY9_9GAMM|nr:UvrD-helicase domain-containing protein [Psittacicella gerlachiana]RIY38571.1 hypothetical protein CKF59_00600 [Psittacicella gerlachiana]